MVVALLVVSPLLHVPMRGHGGSSSGRGTICCFVGTRLEQSTGYRLFEGGGLGIGLGV